MNKLGEESLEYLVTEKLLGRMSADVAALFEIYCEQNPEVRREVKSMEETLSLVQLAMERKNPVVTSLPEPRFLKRAKAQPSPFLAWRSIGRLAALLAIGFFVGWMAQGFEMQRRIATVNSVSVETVVPPASVQAAMPVQTIQPNEVSDSQFWSSRPWREDKHTTKSSAGRGLVWESPVRKPVLKDNL